MNVKLFLFGLWLWSFLINTFGIFFYVLSGFIYGIQLTNLGIEKKFKEVSEKIENQ